MPDHLILMVPDRGVCIVCNGEGWVSTPSFIEVRAFGELAPRIVRAGSESSKCPDCNGTGRDLPSGRSEDF